MPRVRYTVEEGGVYRIPGTVFEPGGEADVDDDTAEHLVERDDFEILESADEGEGEDVEAEETDEADETCTVEKDDGEVCGRELPCRYHTDDEADDGGD